MAESDNPEPVIRVPRQSFNMIIGSSSIFRTSVAILFAAFS